MKYTEKEIIRIAQSAIGKKIGDYDKRNRLHNVRNKGSIGNVIQSGLFGLPENSSSAPDFSEIGIELKVTPFRIIKSTNDKKYRYVAKERLSLHSINFDRDLNIPLRQSELWKKCRKMLIIFYEYCKNIPIDEFIISAVMLWDIEKENQQILENDWGIIQRFILEGKAQEISEKYTSYIGASTKGKNAHDLVSQPMSDIQAARRAYCLKQRYMTSIISNLMNNHTSQNSNMELLEGEIDMSKTLIQNIQLRLESYYGKSSQQLLDEFGIIANGNDKGVYRRITWAILNAESQSAKRDLDKAGIVVKTIRLEEDGTNREAMSFPAFSFVGIAKEEWKDSFIYNLFSQNTFLFVVYKKNGEHYSLLKSFFWKMPENDLNEKFKNVYMRTKEVINNGVIFGEGSRVTNNLPKESESSLAHVRPHAARASYTPLDPNADMLPDGRWMTKQCFFLNKSYVREIIKKNLGL